MLTAQRWRPSMAAPHAAACLQGAGVQEAVTRLAQGEEVYCSLPPVLRPRGRGREEAAGGVEGAAAGAGSDGRLQAARHALLQAVAGRYSQRDEVGGQALAG